MNKFTYTYPTRVYFGEGIAAEALTRERPQVGKTVLLAYGGGSIKRSGIYEEIRGLLTQAGKEVVDFAGIMPNPTYAKVQQGAQLARERQVDFILAVGGGSVADCCKVIAVQAKTQEDIWNMEYASGKLPTSGIPMGAVVTASGTGAEMNSGAVITYEEKLWKGPIVGSAPSFAVLDPLYTATVPPMQVLSGAFDILDPRTGYPARSDLASVTIISKEGKLCDALSTAIFVMGLDRGIGYWQSHGDFDMLLMTQSGEIYLTEGMEGRFTLTDDFADREIHILKR